MTVDVVAVVFVVVAVVFVVAAVVFVVAAAVFVVVDFSNGLFFAKKKYLFESDRIVVERHLIVAGMPLLYVMLLL